MSQSDKVPETIIFMEIQASGKSIFSQQSFAWDFMYISLNSLHTKTNEAKLLKECLEQRASFVVGNTNPTAGDRKRYIQAARENGYKIEECFFQSLVKNCVQRDSRHLGKTCVPDRAIAYTPNRLEMPVHDEGSDRLYFIYIRNGGFKVDKWKNQCFNERER